MWVSIQGALENLGNEVLRILAFSISLLELQHSDLISTV